MEDKINLLEETEAALANHHRTWNAVKFIRNSIGYIPMADFVAMARQINYDNHYGVVEVDPSLMIVGGSWWLERFNYDGREGWIFCQKPERPALPAAEVTLQDTYGYYKNADWEDRIETIHKGD